MTEDPTQIDVYERGSLQFLTMRRHKNLVNDPRFYFQLARLVGMCEMLAKYMEVHGDEKAKAMAERASPVLEFFFEDG